MRERAVFAAARSARLLRPTAAGKADSSRAEGDDKRRHEKSKFSAKQEKSHALRREMAESAYKSVPDHFEKAGPIVAHYRTGRRGVRMLPPSRLRTWIRRFGTPGIVLVGLYLGLYSLWTRRRTGLLLFVAAFVVVCGVPSGRSPSAVHLRALPTPSGNEATFRGKERANDETANYMRSQARYTVIGPTDPATGIRIEYTIPCRYIQKRNEDDTFKHRPQDAFTDWQFTPSLPAPLRHGIRKSNLGSSDAALEPESNNPITQTSSKHSQMAGWYVDSQGYVSIDKRHGPRFATVCSQEYRLVGGCPTTLLVEDSDLYVDGHPMQYYDLLVRPRGQTVIYVFQTTGIEGTSPNLDVRELKAIRESIRVVKAK